MGQAKRRGSFEERKAESMSNREKELIHAPEVKDRLIQKMKEPGSNLREQLLALKKDEIIISHKTSEGEMGKDIFTREELQEQCDKGKHELKHIIHYIDNRESEYPIAMLTPSTIIFASFSKADLQF